MFTDTLAKNNGQITFNDYVCALSNLCRGTMEDKIKWIFTLYDINKDGMYIYIYIDIAHTLCQYLNNKTIIYRTN